MSIAGIDKLADNRRALLDDARRSGETIQIVDHGEVVAQIVPEPQTLPNHRVTADQHERRASDAAIWEDIDRLAAEIGKEWPDGVSAVDAVRDGRREF